MCFSAFQLDHDEIEGEFGHPNCSSQSIYAYVEDVNVRYLAKFQDHQQDM